MKDEDKLRSSSEIKVHIPEKPADISDELHNGIVKFAHQVRDEQFEHMKGYSDDKSYMHRVHLHTSEPKIKYKKGYAYVDLGGSGKYMVALKQPNGSMAHLAAGDVVGIKGYGVPHPGKRHGNVLKGDTRPRVGY